jgi:hypothetical protein
VSGGVASAAQVGEQVEGPLRATTHGSLTKRSMETSMPQFTYTPDSDVQVHSEGAIRLICAAFQSHENGLPEWLKNAADAYAREDAPEPKRVIVVVFAYGGRAARPSISCLDFSGMTAKMIDENFKYWADPDAARRGASSADVQGGHGNGGKCYMTQMFDDYAVINTARLGRGSRYGVGGGSLRFGYVPDAEAGRSYPVSDIEPELDKALRSVGCRVAWLPAAAKTALAKAKGFTLVTGVGPKGYKLRIPVGHLVDSLQEHPQMVKTLELCRVYVLVNGEAFNQGRPLDLPQIAPMTGAEVPRKVAIPATLRDPQSDEAVSTTEDGSLGAGELILKTSNVSMRYGKKGRHIVAFMGSSGYIGYVPVLELDIQSPYRDRIYGECKLESLDPFKQNERARLANSPLSRAVERFIGNQIQLYAKEFEALDRRRYDQDEKSALSRMNEALDQWKNRFLSEILQGLWGSGEGGGQTQRDHLPSGKAERIEVSLSHSMAGVGVAFRPALKFYDAAGRQIRPTPFRWVSDDNNVAMVDQELMVINTFSCGQTRILAQTLDGRLRSNSVPLEVVRIVEIQITPANLKLAAGTRSKLEALCRLASGQTTSAIYLVWTESNKTVARVSASGLVFGFWPGQTEVVAGDDRCLAGQPATVTVEASQGRGRGDKAGRGYPRVLISDCDADPDTNEQVVFSREDPPVWQRPQDVDRNIWWVNSAAPFARMYLDDATGYGYESREWRMYLLERYMEILVQIAFTHGPHERETLSVGDWVLRWGEQVAEIQAVSSPV